MSNKSEFAVFEALDLAPIKMKLMHVESGEGWSERRANAVEAEYRRFLFLTHAYPDDMVSPTLDVDMFWHYHILDTMKYARDCEATFGFFLHHYPYVGMAAGTGNEHVQAGERMRALYEAEFGVVVRGDAAFCASPGKQAGATAFCAYPGKPAPSASATAFCAYPGKPATAASATAFCAYPGKPAIKGADSAFCASPGLPAIMTSKIAFCASPGKRA